MALYCINTEREREGQRAGCGRDWDRHYSREPCDSYCSFYRPDFAIFMISNLLFIIFEWANKAAWNEEKCSKIEWCSAIIPELDGSCGSTSGCCAINLHLIWLTKADVYMRCMPSSQIYQKCAVDGKEPSDTGFELELGEGSWGTELGLEWDWELMVAVAALNCSSQLSGWFV